MMVRDISAILQVCHSIYAVLQIILKPNVIFLLLLSDGILIVDDDL